MPRADAVRSAERIVAAARALVAERGAEVPLDEVARRAGVGNATLYRHFPTRGDLLVAVYADEVEALCARARELATAADPAAALFDWLGDFVEHVATKRDLAVAATDGATGRRAERFDAWHAAMHEAARTLLDRARAAGGVLPDVGEHDLLALARGAALAGTGAADARRLFQLTRTGLEAGGRRGAAG